MHKTIKKVFCLLIVYCFSTCIFAENSVANAYVFYLKGIQHEHSLYAFEARDDFQKALALDPNNQGYLIHYAWFLHQFNFTEQAIAAFNVALKNSPEDQKINIYSGLAWDAFFIGNLPVAIDNFQNIYPSFWLATNYHNAMIAAGNLTGAQLKAKIKILKQQLTQNPNDFSAKTALFNNYIYHMEYKNAVALGSILMTNSKTNNFTRLEFARALFKDKKYYQAENEYHQLMQQFPRNAFLSYEWGTKLVGLGQYDAAYEMFSQSLAEYSTAEAKAAIATLAAQNGHCDFAFNLLSTISSKNNYVYLLGMGNVYRECHQYQQANIYYQHILQEYPYNSDALWGVISSTAAAHQYSGNRIAFDRWQEVYNWNRSLLQNQLVNYYQSPMIFLNGAYYDNSIDFSRSELGGAYDFYAKGNTRLNLAYNYSAFSQEGFDNIFRNMLELQASKLFSEHWQLIAGISEKDYSNKNNNINGDVSLKYTWSKKLNTIFSYKHLDIIDTEPPFGIQIYNYITTIGAVGLNIQTNDYSDSIYYQATRRLSLWGQAIYGQYSDDNTKTQGNFEASYQLFDVPQIKIIYNYFYLNFSNPAPIFTQNNISTTAYFDPRNFQVHTGKIRIEHFFTNNLYIGAEDGVSFFPQNSSFGNAISTYVNYNFMTHLGMRLSGQYYYQDESITRTNDHGDPFWAKAINLSLVYKL